MHMFHMSNLHKIHLYSLDRVELCVCVCARVVVVVVVGLMAVSTSQAFFEGPIHQKVLLTVFMVSLSCEVSFILVFFPNVADCLPRSTEEISA